MAASQLTLEDARPWYPPGDPVHGFDHVQRVYSLAEKLAEAECADVEIVRAAVLLHDASCPREQVEAAEENENHNNRASHHHASARFARDVLMDKGWEEERIEAVLHCIRSHRFRDEAEKPMTLEAQLLFDADKLDAIGAVGVARALGYAVQHNAPLFAVPSDSFLAAGRLQADELHSAYHEYIFKLRHLKDRLHTKAARKLAEERHAFMEAFFERLGAEWRGDQ